MDLGKMGLAGLVGAVLAGTPLFVFIEARIEKRVKQEVEVARIVERQKAALAARMLLEGRVWTVEEEIKSLRLEHANGE